MPFRGWIGRRVRLAAGIAAAPVALAAFAGMAQAATITGISDQNIAGWNATADAVYDRLDLPHARYIAAYDVALHKDDSPCQTPCQRFHELRAWLDEVNSQGKRALISFGDVVGCDRCAAPTSSQYAAGVDSFLREFPTVREFTAWNEPNHKRHVPATLAARYWAELTESCAARAGDDCIVAAGDLNDSGDYRRYTIAYKDSLSAIGAAPKIWSIHPYGAVDSGDFDILLDWVDNYTDDKPVWFSEVGAMYCSPETGLEGTTPAQALDYQDSRAGNLSALLDRVPERVERIYYYFLAKPAAGQETCPGFDSALIGGDGVERPGLSRLFPRASTAGVVTQSLVAWLRDVFADRSGGE